MMTLGHTSENNDGKIISSSLPYEPKNNNTNKRTHQVYTSPSKQQIQNHKNQKTTKPQKNAYLNQLEIISILPTPPKFTSQYTPLTSQEQTQALPNTPIRR
jgi:hypothetical protein